MLSGLGDTYDSLQHARAVSHSRWNVIFRNLNAEEVRLRGDHALSKLIRANVIKTGLDSFQKLKILNTRKIFEKCDLKANSQKEPQESFQVSER